MAKQKSITPDMAIAVILAVVGAYYLLAPHTLHVSSGLGFGLEHATHVILGVVLIVLGAAHYYLKSGMKKK